MITLLAVDLILRLNGRFQIASRWSCGAPLPITQPVLLYLGVNPDPAWNDTQNIKGSPFFVTELVGMGSADCPVLFATVLAWRLANQLQQFLVPIDHSKSSMDVTLCFQRSVFRSFSIASFSIKDTVERLLPISLAISAWVASYWLYSLLTSSIVNLNFFTGLMPRGLPHNPIVY